MGHILWPMTRVTHDTRPMTMSDIHNCLQFFMSHSFIYSNLRFTRGSVRHGYWPMTHWPIVISGLYIWLLTCRTLSHQSNWREVATVSSRVCIVRSIMPCFHWQWNAITFCVFQHRDGWIIDWCGTRVSSKDLIWSIYMSRRCGRQTYRSTISECCTLNQGSRIRSVRILFLKDTYVR